MLHLFISRWDEIIVNGSIAKAEIVLGWGVWTVVALCLAIVIPLIFYGMMKNKYPWLYFAVAILTMSRNALVFSTLTYAGCVIISCFVGRHKKIFRIITLAGILLVAVLGIALWDKISIILKDYLDRGFSDNGRFEIWRAAFDSFLDSPVFGSGFYGMDLGGGQFGFIPKMAHQTILQILGSMGVFGIVCYGYYRVSTVIEVVKKPNTLKTMMGISILTLVCEGMLDNFAFSFYPLFFTVIALAIICRSNQEKQMKISENVN